MQEAKNLLLQERLSVTEIAGQCGYSNASKFAACFRRITGMTPGEWRRSNVIDKGDDVAQ
ncbi:MAG: helix-turn-helix transcriptional regulator [Clostridia bacterium]|nr:helix-turn-helix transcriptional regulator [Clostridia bacterium]